MKRIMFLAVCAFALAGCNNDESAPNVSDVKNIVVDGNKYTPKEYLDAFCQKKDSSSDPNCIRVDKQRIADMSGIKKVKPAW